MLVNNIHWNTHLSFPLTLNLPHCSYVILIWSLDKWQLVATSCGQSLMWNMKLWWKLFIVEQTKVFLFVCKNDALVFRLGTGMLNFMAKRFRDSLSFTAAEHLRAALS